MRMFDVQGIEIAAPHRKVFEFVREPVNLPRWAHAFASAGSGRARLETPAGVVDVERRFRSAHSPVFRLRAGCVAGRDRCERQQGPACKCVVFQRRAHADA